MDKVIHTLSTYPVIEKSRKLKLYTKLSTLSTFYVCGILDLHNRKRTSHNTEVSYQRDLKKMAAYFEERGIYDIREVGELELEGYLSYMERGQFASSTIYRNVASIRALFQYLQQEGRIERDPSLELKPPKVEKRMPEILSVDEVDRLLRQPDLNTPKGIRDSAMLELLYATGMRVSELLHLNLYKDN